MLRLQGTSEYMEVNSRKCVVVPEGEGGREKEEEEKGAVAKQDGKMCSVPMVPSYVSSPKFRKDLQNMYKDLTGMFFSPVEITKGWTYICKVSGTIKKQLTQTRECRSRKKH